MTNKNVPIETLNAAQDIAKMLTEGSIEQAHDEYRKFCNEKKLVFWEQCAFAELVQSYKKAAMELNQ